MLYLKNIFYTTGLSFIIGFYSIYNIFFYIKNIEHKYVNEINQLKEEIKNNNLNYNRLEFEFVEIKNKLHELNNTIFELEEKYKLVSKNELHYNLNDDEYNNNYIKNDIFCDELCDIDINFSPNQKMGTMNSFSSSNLLDYDSLNDLFVKDEQVPNCKEELEVGPDLSKQVRKRAVSVSQVDWSGITKRFLFGV